MTNPFQFVLDFKDKVTKGMQKFGSVLGGIGKKAVGVTSNVDKLSMGVDKLGGIASKAGGLLKGALVFAGVSLALGTLKDNIADVDKEFTSLVTITGSTSQSTYLQDWFDDVTSRVAVNRDSLMELTRQARKFNTTVNDLDIEGLYATSKVTGKSIEDMTASIAEMSQTMKLSYQEAVAKSIELTGTTKNADKIMQAFNSTAFNTEERFKALSSVMAGVVPPDMRMASTSLGEMGTMISSIMSTFGRAFAGDPMKSGPVYQIRMAVGNLLTFLRENMPKIKAVFEAVGKVIGVVIKFITKITGSVVKMLAGIFGSLKSDTDGFNKNVVLPFVTFIEIIIAQISSFIESFGSGIKEGLSGIGDIIRPYIKEISALMGPLIDALGFGDSKPGESGFWKTVGKIIGGTLKVIISLATVIIAKIMPHLINIIVKFREIFGKVFQKVGEIFSKIVKLITGGSGDSGAALQGLLSVVGFVADMIGYYFEIIVTVIGWAVDAVLLVLDGLIWAIEAVVSNVSKFKNAFVSAFNFINNTVTRVWNTIKKIFDKITAFFKNELTGALGAVGKVWNQIFGEDEESIVSADLSKNITVTNPGQGSGSGGGGAASAINQATRNLPEVESGKGPTIVVQPVPIYLNGKRVDDELAASRKKKDFR